MIDGTNQQLLIKYSFGTDCILRAYIVHGIQFLRAWAYRNRILGLVLLGPDTFKYRHPNNQTKNPPPLLLLPNTGLDKLDLDLESTSRKDRKEMSADRDMSEAARGRVICAKQTGCLSGIIAPLTFVDCFSSDCIHPKCFRA